MSDSEVTCSKILKNRLGSTDLGRKPKVWVLHFKRLMGRDHIKLVTRASLFVREETLHAREPFSVWILRSNSWSAIDETVWAIFAGGNDMSVSTRTLSEAF